MSLELQQRSCEYSQLYSEQLAKIRAGVVARMPMPPKRAKKDKDEKETKTSDKQQDTAGEDSGPEMDDENDAVEEEDEEERKAKSQVPISKKPAENNVLKSPEGKTLPVADNKPAIFDILGGAMTQQIGPVAIDSAPQKKNDLDILSELFAPVGNTTPANKSVDTMTSVPITSSLPFNVFDTPQPKPTASSPASSKYPPAVVYESKTLSVKFSYDVNPGTPEVVEVTALFSNNGDSAMTNFDFQVAVPKYITLKMQPPSSTTLNPGAGVSSPAVTQVIRLENTQHGKKKIIIKVRLNYQINGQSVVEDTQISQFPDTSAT
jgi:AP-1 complex subunit gamma-1